MSEATGGGVGWIDYDLDGDYDIYLIQGGDPTDESASPSDQLFRNGQSHFLPAPVDAIGIREGRYGQGISVGDFDNDGFPDIYVTNLGRNTLLQNQGDGTFQDVTEQAGVAGRYLWSSSAAWGDIDRDGDLDLFVCNYLDYDPRHPIPCFDVNGNRATCDPQQVDSLPNDFFLNQGDGTFIESSEKRRLVGEGSKSLGVVVADLDGDRFPDIFVANDTTSNFLYRNRGDASFDELGIESGCAMSAMGHNQASMGVAFGDYDRDSNFDLYVTHFLDDSNTLYRGLGRGLFEDATRRTSLHQPTLPYLGFGTVMLDFNQDGRDELFVANGHIDDVRFRGEPWKMPAQMFSFDGIHWQEIGQQAGDYFQLERLGRGVAYCDFDNDGDPDLAVANQDDPTALLVNESIRGHWLNLSFRGRKSNRLGQGVHVVVEQNSAVLVQELAGGTSYCASHQPVMFFGLGDDMSPCRLSIRWPSGIEQDFGDVDVNRSLVVDELDGISERTHAKY